MKKNTQQKYDHFVKEYVKNGRNAHKAYLSAGYKEGTGSKNSAARLLDHPYVKEKLAKYEKELNDKLEFDGLDVLRELGKLGFSNMSNYSKINKHGELEQDCSTLTEEQYAAIKSVKRTVSKVGDVTTIIELHDKKGALDSLNKHFHLEKLEDPEDGAKGIAVVFV